MSCKCGSSHNAKYIQCACEVSQASHVMINGRLNIGEISRKKKERKTSSNLIHLIECETEWSIMRTFVFHYGSTHLIWPFLV